MRKIEIIVGENVYFTICKHDDAMIRCISYILRSHHAKKTQTSCQENELEDDAGLYKKKSE